MTAKFLIKDDGHVYIYTEALAARKDMRPYEPEAHKNEPEAHNDALTEEFLSGFKGPNGKQHLCDIAFERLQLVVDPGLHKSEIIEKILKAQSEPVAEG